MGDPHNIASSQKPMVCACRKSKDKNNKLTRYMSDELTIVDKRPPIGLMKVDGSLGGSVEEGEEMGE